MTHALLTPKETAAFLKITPRTLEDWRKAGRGPKYHKLETRFIRYALPDLEEWLSASTRATSQSLAN